MTAVLFTLAILGVLLSIYATHIQKRAEKKPNAKSVCDISEGMNCSAVIGSKYNKTFGVSNALGGILFYLLIFILKIRNKINLM